MALQDLSAPLAHNRPGRGGVRGEPRGLELLVRLLLLRDQLLGLRAGIWKRIQIISRWEVSR